MEISVCVSNVILNRIAIVHVTAAQNKSASNKFYAGIFPDRYSKTDKINDDDDDDDVKYGIPHQGFGSSNPKKIIQS